jgi:site-specific DNA-methyltransferase (adenine-specific)
MVLVLGVSLAVLKMLLKINDLESEKSSHPTVKPTDLMRYLCRLVTQPGGTVLDPFMGSGTTGKAAMLDGFEFIGCEMDEQYYKIAEARIRHALER